MIIVIANQKGGVGKTTTAINLASGCALQGKRILLMDLDPQSNSTLSFITQNNINGSAYELLTDLESDIEKFIYRTDTIGLDLIPSKINLAKLESKLVGDFDAVFKLKDRIEPLRDKYDLIIFDTPPTLGLITVNALVAATHILIPIQASYFALEGTDDLLDTIEKVRSRPNPDLKLLGVLVTLVDKRTSLAKDVETYIRNKFAQMTFKTTISRSVRLEESPANKETIYTFAPKSSGALEYEELCKEVLQHV